MAENLTTSPFLNALKQSGLIESEQLERLLAELPSDGQSGDIATKLRARLLADGMITRWQAEKLSQGKHRGFFLGKYKLLDIVGRGGMSMVYLAEHKVMKRRCALKVLPSKKVDESSHLGRFHLEAQAVASLDHPNIVRAYDIDHAMSGNTEVHFFVMEYVQGQSLHELVTDHGPLDPRRAADYIRQAALGLAHAHERGLIHRDVKPGNFLIDHDGTVKMLDLGLARYFGEADEQSLTIQHDEKVLGTADYLSPEQALSSHNVDARADVYSLGCTFYFLLVGRPPFEYESLAQRLMAHQTQDPPKVGQLRDDVPAELQRIIDKMMAKAPEDRYQTADELVAALGAWLGGNGGVKNPGEATAATTPPRTESSEFSTIDTEEAAKPADTFAATDAKPTDDAGANGSDSTDHVGSFIANLGDESVTTSRRESPSSRTRLRSGKRSSKITKSAPEPEAQPVPVVNSETKANKTAPQPGESPALPVETNPPPSAIRRRKKKRGSPPIPVLIAIGAAVLLIVVIGSWALFFRGGDKPKETSPKQAVAENQEDKKPNTPKAGGDKQAQWTVGPTGQFKSLAQALAAVKKLGRFGASGKTITIKVTGGQTLKESLVIDNSEFGYPKGVKIVREGAEPVVLLPAKEGSPILKLVQVEEWEIDGFTFDGQGANSPLIEMSGYCVKTMLKNLILNGFANTAIMAKDLSGFSRSETVFERLTFQGNAGTAQGIHFASDEQAISDMHVVGCEFLGPMKAGIEISGNSVTSIKVSESKFLQVTSGVRFSSEGISVQTVSFLNNSFAHVANGVVFEKSPSTLSNDVSFYRNLFVDVSGTEVGMAKSAPTAIASTLLNGANRGAQHNWSTRTANGGSEGEYREVSIFHNNGRAGVQNLTFVSEEPADGNFLKPVHPQIKIGGNPPAGQKPYVGAVAP